MRFTYDPTKNDRNIAERRLALDLVEEFDWSTALIAEDTRQEYPEHRYQALDLISVNTCTCWCLHRAMEPSM